MKKKLYLIMICALMICTFAACGKNDSDKHENSAGTTENTDNVSDTGTEDNFSTEAESSDDFSDISSMEYEEAKEYLDSLPETDASYFEISTEDMAEGEAAITKYSGTDPVVVIPETIDGLTIVQLSKWSFTDNETVEAVKVPETVRTLDDSAFEICSNLIYVTGLEHVEKLGDAVFNGSMKLRYLEFTDSVTEIKGYIVFYNKEQLTIKAPKDSYIAEYVQEMIDTGDDYLTLEEY